MAEPVAPVPSPAAIPSVQDGFRAEFLSQLGFPLDDFQVRALDALDAGRSVLVAAPTGSGKTVVAEYAVAKAFAMGGKAFYTSPLKALSNQKYGDLARRHGTDRVGLLTGDNAINPEAPAVVMTTEVLRNMIYASSPLLDGLRYVVLDEVHYLQDAYRGPVWEEVIIHTPHDVSMVCLSATVSNAEQFADWVETVRGETAAVIEERRPVQLHHLFLLGDRSSQDLHLLPTFVADRPNPEVAAIEERAWRRVKSQARQRPTLFAPRRAEVVSLLWDEGMLPAIYFIFSRAACTDAVQQCLRAGLRLTTTEERAEIRVIAESKVEVLSDEDLRVLDYGAWISGLEAGFAAHHAGMVPPFKEAVEACFAAALVKAVFATETLALGINMPARSVVIERVTKFNGENVARLTPGEYTQLTGRAGRRGIDDTGYAIVLWSPFVRFDEVCTLVSNRSYELRSAFRPTYNMAANLVRRYPPDEAHHLLNLSFAQYQTDTQVVRLEANLERYHQDIAKQHQRMKCDRGEVEEYRQLLREHRQRSQRRRGFSKNEIREAARAIVPGDVLPLPDAPDRTVVIVATAHRKGGKVRLSGLDKRGREHELSPDEYKFPPRRLARVTLPHPYRPDAAEFRTAAVELLRNVGGTDAPLAGFAADDTAAEAVEEHPVASCPDARHHVRAADLADRLARQAKALERDIRSHSESLARQFDRVLRVLEAWGYVDGWSLTEWGERLCRTFHEADLLVAETVRSGLFDGLDVPAVAALASVFTYEARGRTPVVDAALPTPELRRRCESVGYVLNELRLAEEEAGLPLTRGPDTGFAALAYEWAAGRELDEVLGDEELSGGDFVRNVKQLIDLLRQLGDMAPEPATRRAARQAADQLFRGVVSASSVVGDPAASSDA